MLREPVCARAGDNGGAACDGRQAGGHVEVGRRGAAAVQGLREEGLFRQMEHSLVQQRRQIEDRNQVREVRDSTRMSAREELGIVPSSVDVPNGLQSPRPAAAAGGNSMTCFRPHNCTRSVPSPP